MCVKVGLGLSLVFKFVFKGYEVLDFCGIRLILNWHLQGDLNGQH